MKKSFKIALAILLILGAFALSAFYVSTYDIAVLMPKGMIGLKERHLIVTASLLMLIVVIPVFLLTWFFAWRYREKREAKHTPDWEHNYIAEYCWWGIPFVIVLVLAVLCWKSSHQLDPFKPLSSDKKPVTVQVVALEWKWLFLYPEQGIATINYLQIPEKTPINFDITADAPMNSFWIPQLGGQIYAMPAMRSKLHLLADGVGTYRGVSANFSGKGFAGMKFKVDSVTQNDFQSWVQRVRSSGQALNFTSYERLVEPSESVPPAFYSLSNTDLFEEVLMKYEPQ